MTVLDVLVRLEEAPLRYLDSQSLLGIQAFMAGYSLVDESARAPMRQLADRLPGPSTADACTRGYLRDGNGAFSQMLSDLIGIVRSSSAQPRPSLLSHERFIDLVREPVMSGRPGMVASELSVVWLGDAVSGYLCGLEVLASPRAHAERLRLSEFEGWLRQRYNVPYGSWCRLLRVFEGAGTRGLRRYVELFDEFERVADASG